MLQKNYLLRIIFFFTFLFSIHSYAQLSRTSTDTLYNARIAQSAPYGSCNFHADAYDKCGNLYVGGNTEAPGLVNVGTLIPPHMLIMKYGPFGNLIWKKIYNP